MRLEVDKEGGGAFVTIVTESLDAGNVQEFKQLIAPVLEKETKVVLDLKHVQFVDSSGLGSMLSCLRQLNARGGNLVLCTINKPVRTLFELVRMHRVFDIMNTREEAKAALNS